MGRDVEHRRTGEPGESRLGHIAPEYTPDVGKVRVDVLGLGERAGEAAEALAWAVVGIGHDYGRRARGLRYGEPQQVPATGDVADELLLDGMAALRIDQRLERDEVDLAVGGQDEVRDP